ncbi:hypothetical protein B0I35DRAFT_346098 [Stachybotrys elegans]|uniref:Uncharacterized protein n=1 Tax=Stachybotrys elegans TaxID=80388 RepID=A0A8K0WYU7_9HYPO|nr:hypothetical protein B0I35DRAFT_346098 [Stachybotrys elegans]
MNPATQTLLDPSTPSYANPAADPVGLVASPSPNQLTQSAASSGHDGTNMYACRHCGRSYSRPEHLVRHVQSHTLGRRFACDICKKAFARKDLLRRHIANHEKGSPSKRRRHGSSAASMAARVSQACRACAVARVKCDDSKPCQRCTARNLVCVSSDSGPAATLNLAQLSADPRMQSSNSDSTPRSGLSSPASYGPSRPPLTSSGSNQSISTRGTQEVFLKSEETGQLLPLIAASECTDNGYPPFHEFLRDLLSEPAWESSKFAESQGLAILDCCDDANVELTDVDVGVLGGWSIRDAVPPAPRLGKDTDSSTNISQMRHGLVNVWKHSPWLWDPGANDSGYREQGNLPLTLGDTASAKFQEIQRRLERVVSENLNQSGRDQAMAAVLETCRSTSTRARVAASFPTVDVMDMLIHMFLHSHACLVSSWIHFPTFALNAQEPGWIAIAAAAGALLTPIPAFRKFGLAIQEAVRKFLCLQIPSSLFEGQNAAVQDPTHVQTLILVQDLGVWSGNRRKMEIAECYIQFPITMMRYRNRFQRSSYSTIAVDPSEDGAILERKWRSWTEREQWKRLIFHCYLRDAQTSMMALTSMSISYAELTLPLPESRELWFAKNAQQWTSQYLEQQAGSSSKAPSLGDVLSNVHLLRGKESRLDMQFAVSIVLHGFWSLIFEFRQLSTIHRWQSYTTSSPGTAGMLLNSRRQEILRDLQEFESIITELQDVSAQEFIVLSLLMMNLHVSMNDLQLFAGKEGEAQARRVFPVLQEWVRSSEARATVWHAGQILRYAKCFPAGHLKDFYAIAVHHASLALWAFAVLTRVDRRESVPDEQPLEVIYLDGTHSMWTRRFIDLGQGQPVIRGPARDGRMTEASLQSPKACMGITQEILRANGAHGEDCLPAIVENLCQLLGQLGDAAGASWAQWLAMPQTVLVATTTAILTASFLTLARAVSWPRRPQVLPSPRKLPLPAAAKEQLAELVPVVDELPGARDVETPYGTIRVYEFGPEDGQKVLFVHGISTSCVTLSRIARSLVKRGCRVMLFDLFGRGYSDGVGDLPHDHRLYVTQILLVLASSPLAWTGNNAFHLVGYSMGGGISVHFANAYPHLVSDLVLLAPAGLIRAESFGLARHIYTSGFVPEPLLARLTSQRLQQPIAASRSKNQPLESDPQLDIVEAEAADPVPGEDATPLERRVLKYVRWMVLHHPGFVPAFMSCLRYAPMVDQHQAWGQLAQRKPGSTILLFGKRDEIIDIDDYTRDALPLVGGHEKAVWKILNGGHDFVMTHYNEIVLELDTAWGMKEIS